MAIEPTSLYFQLRDLVASIPDLHISKMHSREFLVWQGRAFAPIQEVGDPFEIVSFRSSMSALFTRNRDEAVERLPMIIHRALATAELRAPIGVQGAFIPVGSVFDAMQAVGKIIQSAQSRVLVVDPYMDEKALTEFAVLAEDNILIQLLADSAYYKPALKPAVVRWADQYGATRLVEARLAAPRSLHDRLIVVDAMEVWVLTQSLNGIAKRSHASIVRPDPDAAILKIAAYEAIWQTANTL